MPFGACTRMGLQVTVAANGERRVGLCDTNNGEDNV